MNPVSRCNIWEQEVTLVLKLHVLKPVKKKKKGKEKHLCEIDGTQIVGVWQLKLLGVSGLQCTEYVKCQRKEQRSEAS